ncbi:MAG: Arc family DNA-binding protein [Rhodobacteraceae bacterium]|nr:Arc family DNA-binding protein [Paracoccaceae bacterium]
MVQDSSSRKQDQYIVRFPDGLRDRIKKAAADNNRSMNAEIVDTLEYGYPEPQISSTIEMVDYLAGEFLGLEVSEEEIAALEAKIRHFHDMVLGSPELHLSKLKASLPENSTDVEEFKRKVSGLPSKD